MPNSTMNQDVVINKLLVLGIISRTTVRGRYTVCDRPNFMTFRRDQILERFTIEQMPGRHVLRRQEMQDALNAGGVAASQAAQAEVLRTLNRRNYHSNAISGGQRTTTAAALAAIAPDEDGVVRSFGIEYEVYELTPVQEDKLAKLLDTMPAHIVERDGSLGRSGVEIVFDPVDAATYIEIVNKLRAFVQENGIRMGCDEYAMAGMHTTYGVSNAEASISDLQIRLNRYALALKSIATQGQIKQLFGRDFGHYRVLPQSTTFSEHSNAFSCNGRPRTCWECRLADYRCNPEMMVKFFKLTETAFHRATNAEDFARLFELIGGGRDGQ